MSAPVQASTAMFVEDKTREVATPTEERIALARWVEVCRLEDITPGTGAAALIDGEQIAIVRPHDDDRVYALSNFDPFSKAFVIARGIVGDRSGTLKIASPVYKQNFNLETGECLDDPSVSLPTYEARVIEGRIQVKIRQFVEES